MNEQFLIALIASGSALLGSAIGQLGQVVQHWLSARHERRVVLRQKYEQMATLAGDLPVHLSQRFDVLRKGAIPEGRQLLQSANQMHMLALLYFPKLAPAMQELRDTANRLDLALKNNKDATEATAATDAFATANMAAMQAIQEHATRYT